MDRVSTSGLYGSVITNLMTAQSAQADAGAQVSSQKKATDLKGFGSQAQTLTAMQTVQSQIQTYLDQSQLTSSKLSVQDSAMTQISDSVTAARKAIADALASGSGDTLMQAMGTSFQNGVSALNTTYNGQYLFAGGQVNTKPVTATAMTDLTTAPSIASLFQNDQHITATQIDQNTSIKTGFVADQLGTGMLNAFQSIQSFSEGANGPFTGKLTTAQTTFLQSQLAVFDSVSTGLTTAQAQNGLMQSQLSSTQTDLGSRSTTMQGLIGNITDADLAQASANLTQAQQAVQASAQVFASLRSSSLVSLLPVA
ncbi:MAG: flagellin [Caulobacteraceae bacterium]|nr:flagellin [Caulobacteraceae bacterium]